MPQGRSSPSGSAGPASAWLTVARITKTQGRRGEVAAQILTNFPQALAERAEVFLWDGRVQPTPAQVEKTWFHKKYLIFKFSGCDSISAAQELVGREIQIPRAVAAPLPEASYYFDDLVGCRVVEAATGVELGSVRAVQDDSGAVRLVVETPEGKELLIPFAQEFCPRIAPEEKLIEVTLPAGLRDLNP